MAELKSANVTKYDNGGSGDNYIGNGLIKSVEKIWTDTYTLGSVTTNDSICIARIPANKQLIDVIVHMPATSSAVTTGTVGLHLATSPIVNSGTASNLGDMKVLSGGVNETILSVGTSSTLQVGPSGFLATTGTTELGLWLIMENAGGGTIDTTGGTLKTVVRYT